MDQEKGSNRLQLFRDIVIAVAIIIIIMQFIRPTLVVGNSMEGTLNDNDYLFMSKQAYLLSDIERGDIVVFRRDLPSDNEGEIYLIKRVIGLPGDLVEIKDGMVFVNELELSEPYINEDYTPGLLSEVIVPKGKYFVLGDNRSHSTDSRSAVVGFVGEKEIKGKAVFRMLPLKGIGAIE